MRSHCFGKPSHCTKSMRLHDNIDSHSYSNRHMMHFYMLNFLPTTKKSEKILLAVKIHGLHKLCTPFYARYWKKDVAALRCTHLFHISFFCFFLVGSPCYRMCREAPIANIRSCGRILPIKTLFCTLEKFRSHCSLAVTLKKIGQNNANEWSQLLLYDKSIDMRLFCFYS